jgi:hypothetical protein
MFFPSCTSFRICFCSGLREIPVGREAAVKEDGLVLRPSSLSSDRDPKYLEAFSVAVPLGKNAALGLAGCVFQDDGNCRFLSGGWETEDSAGRFCNVDDGVFSDSGEGTVSLSTFSEDAIWSFSASWIAFRRSSVPVRLLRWGAVCSHSSTPESESSCKRSALDVQSRSTVLIPDLDCLAGCDIGCSGYSVASNSTTCKN